jgi:hypothetical protein
MARSLGKCSSVLSIAVNGGVKRKAKSSDLHFSTPQNLVFKKMRFYEVSGN